ncbi:MAG: two-component sensor histidine kinase, partial [Actinomycetota bacterium]
QAWGEPGAGSQFRLTIPRRVGGDLTASPLPLMPDDAAQDAGLSGVGRPYRRLRDDGNGRNGRDDQDESAEVSRA